MPLSTVLGAQSLVQPAVCTTATRPASPYTGQAIYDTTTATQLIWNGTAWVGTGGGLVCVKAETAFSAVSSFTADNVFTSSYSNYKMIMNFTATTSGSVTTQFRVGGVAAATNYNFQYLSAISTSIAGARSAAQTSFRIGYGSNGSFLQGLWLELTGPQLAQATSFYSNLANCDASFATPDFYNFYGNHSTATAYDGLAVSISSGTMTGTYAIYGYAKTV